MVCSLQLHPTRFEGRLAGIGKAPCSVRPRIIPVPTGVHSKDWLEIRPVIGLASPVGQRQSDAWPEASSSVVKLWGPAPASNQALPRRGELNSGPEAGGTEDS
jgi:hypothetical protein